MGGGIGFVEGKGFSRDGLFTSAETPHLPFKRHIPPSRRLVDA